MTNVTKVLLRLSKAQHLRGLRQDPKMRDILSGIHGSLHAQEVANAITSKELADISFALGKLQMNDDVVVNILKRIADISKFKAETFTPHDMSGIVWGFASLCVRNEPLMSVVAAEVVNQIENFDQRHLSNTAWAFAKCGLWNEQLVDAIANQCLAKISTFTAQSLSHISWAMAQWGTRKDALMHAVAKEVQKKTGEFAPAPLAMTAWSFASLQLKDTPLMSAISVEAIGKMDKFKTQDLAHLAWAFANLRIQDGPLFDKMAEEIQRNISGTLPPELANIAWAFSKNNFSSEELMSAIAKEAVIQIRNFKSAEVAMLTWAFAVAGLQNRQLMSEIGSQVARKIEKFSAPQLSHIAWAFGALQLRHSEFLHSLSSHVHCGIKTFKAQGLSNIAWAFAMVSFRDENLIRSVAPEIARDAGELRPLALARCAWAYRALAVHSPRLMAAISKEAVKKVDDFPTKALVKLVDSVYVSHSPGELPMLQGQLAKRTMELAEFLQSTWRLDPAVSVHAVDAQAYCSSLQEFGLGDFGIVGTPLLLSQLSIQLPSAAFIQRCRRQAWQHEQANGADSRPPGSCLSGREEELFSVAEVSVTWPDGHLRDWVVRHAPEALPVDAEEAETRQDDWLIACPLAGRQGRQETTCQVLEELRSRLCGLSKATQRGRPQLCNPEVEGSVQVLSTAVPCLSTIGAMWQFKVLFPKVTLEFAEQVGPMGDTQY